MKSVFLLSDLKIFDFVVFAQMLKKFYDEIAEIQFSFIAGIYDAALLKNIGEGNGRRHFMEFNLLNAVHHVEFDGNSQWGIILVGNIEKSCVVS